MYFSSRLRKTTTRRLPLPQEASLFPRLRGMIPEIDSRRIAAFLYEERESQQYYL